MKNTVLALLVASLAAFGVQLSDKTMVRCGAMVKPPKIDGRIDLGEWDYASTTFGGITPATGLMTFRECNFRLGYDKDNLYFACTSEMPRAPQPLYPADLVEIRLLPPGADKPIVVKSGSTGKGSLPEGTRVANDFYADLLTSYLRKCWTIEMAIPLKAIGVKSIGEDKAAWGLQMKRQWESMPETSVWHHGRDAEEMGTFIPDKDAPIVSFDSFGHAAYRENGDYCWPHRIENPGAKPISIVSESVVHAFNNPPTIDMINLEAVGDARRIVMSPSNLTVKPGGTEYVDLYMQAQFAGNTRQLFSLIKDKATGAVLYRRSMYWDVGKGQKYAVYKNDMGLPYLCTAFLPSCGNKLRYSCTFFKKLPCMKVVVQVKDEKGNVLKSFRHSNFGMPLADFESETFLPGLPNGKYFVTMDAEDAEERHHAMERTFKVASFPWQGNNLGKDRVIIPPFKPLQVKKAANEVHALMTGYRIGGELWDRIYCQESLDSKRENILAAPVRFVLNGKHFGKTSTRLVSQEDDKVVYETTSYTDEAKLVINQEYDFDGFCKASIKLYPRGLIRVNDFALVFTLKNDVVEYYSTLDKSGNRSADAPDLRIPQGEGVLNMKGAMLNKGMHSPYIWLGGIYKGFCLLNDTSKDFCLKENSTNIIVSRDAAGITCRYDIVNKSTLWQEPKSYVFGFEPTPVKPQVEGIRAIGEYMYDYPPPKGALWASMNFGPNIVNSMFFYPGTLINNDTSYFDRVFAHRGKPDTEAERKAFVKDFMARNESWIRKNMPTVSIKPLLTLIGDKRKYGIDYFMSYNNPVLYSCHWPETEMYKAEWMPWDYPADDAISPYVGTVSNSYLDMMLWNMRNSAKRGWDGMNFDCFPLGGGRNTNTAGAFRSRPGQVPNINGSNMLQIASAGITRCYTLFHWRELTRRTAIMLYKEGKSFMGYPWVELHSTHCQCIPVTAFCTSTITWERSSRGNEYPRRFPHGFIMAETAGTQSGTIPRCIVSSHAPTEAGRMRIAETLVSTTFAYGLLNHCDQGVIRNSKDYKLWRDYVFDFGYGRPQNKTLLFYSHEKQPVTCASKNILTSQVIRPDGKALILIGNSGDATKAVFDVSGLKYGKCRFTDIRSGKEIDKPELDIPKYSYGMLLIEKM